jgi:hypothetical protein
VGLPILEYLQIENRRLRALNDEMLAALKQIYRYETVYDPNRGELFNGAINAVRIAIQNAEDDND